jgi:hypothetical protein
MSDIYKEFGVDVLRDCCSENEGPTAAEMKMAQEIKRLRARVEVLERACRLIEADPDPNAVVECVACYRHSRLAYHALEAKP